jgi:hypothetical protein
MTDATETRDTLYITDAELIRRLGVPEKIARVTIRSLDGNPQSGFPRKSPLFGDRRYWPAVKAYLDSLNRVDTIQATSYRRPQDQRKSA